MSKFNIKVIKTGLRINNLKPLQIDGKKKKRSTNHLYRRAGVWRSLCLRLLRRLLTVSSDGVVLLRSETYISAADLAFSAADQKRCVQEKRKKVHN